MVFDETENDSLIVQLRAKYDLVNAEARELSNCIQNLESIKSEETATIDPQDPTKIIRNKIVPKDKGTSKEMNPARRNAIFDENKLLSANHLP